MVKSKVKMPRVPNGGQLVLKCIVSSGTSHKLSNKYILIGDSKAPMYVPNGTAIYHLKENDYVMEAAITSSLQHRLMFLRL